MRLLHKYGISPRHITKLIPVSRQTASAWLNKDVAPNQYMQPKLDALNAAIRAAVKYGEFPPHKKFTGTVRDTYIITILRKYMEGPGKELATSA